MASTSVAWMKRRADTGVDIVEGEEGEREGKKRNIFCVLLSASKGGGGGIQFDDVCGCKGGKGRRRIEIQYPGKNWKEKSAATIMTTSVEKRRGGGKRWKEARRDSRQVSERSNKKKKKKVCLLGSF